MTIIQYPVLETGSAELQLAISEHAPIDPKVLFSVASAGGEGSDVETTYKGRDLFTTFESKPLQTSLHWADVVAFLDATERREQFTVFAESIPLVGVNYVAFRADDKRGIAPLHNNRFFKLKMRLQIVRIETV